MDLAYTEEQILLQNSIQKWIEDKYDLTTRNKLAQSDIGFSRDNWKEFAQLGWLAIPFSMDDGGIGGDAVDIILTMEEFGKGLVVEPFMPTVVMVGAALNLGGSDEQKAALIPKIIDGELIATYAYAEAQSHHNDFDIQTTAVKDGDFYVINGQKSVVLNGAAADKILVSTRTSGDQTDENGISLLLVDASAEGVKIESYPTVDGLHASEITFDNVRVPQAAVVGEADNGGALVTAIANRAILAVAAEAVGAMEVLYKSTIEYTKQREQFDHPLSEFQVLKHRMTEMFMEHSLAKSLCMKATMLESQNSEETQRTIHALKYLIGKASRFVGQNAVQLHGGMGMTEELAIAHYFKRLMIIDSQFGNTDHHLTRFVA
jgi:alkylation response protein AidB-like acyl-CoA dehydrogenase